MVKLKGNVLDHRAQEVQTIGKQPTGGGIRCWNGTGCSRSAGPWWPDAGFRWCPQHPGNLTGRWSTPGTAASHTYRVGRAAASLTFALCCFGKSASGTVHTAWVPTFQKRHAEVRKRLAKAGRRLLGGEGAQPAQRSGIAGTPSSLPWVIDGRASWVTQLPI
jgi:hypothetical protein